MKPIIAPSILSADFGYLAKDIEMVNRSEAEWPNNRQWGFFILVIFILINGTKNPHPTLNPLYRYI